MVELNPQNWKDVTTSRGAKYHYYYSPAQKGKVTLLFVHGFPSLGRDWRKVTLPLEGLGYGIIIPDMFGYGGTDKPKDPAQYKLKLLAQDLADILDAENLRQAVAVGHDWGSYVVSRLANYFPERFCAFALLSVPFIVPDPSLSLEDVVGFMTAQLGYNPYGYWSFFNEDDADQVYAAHLDSSVAITYAKDQSIYSQVVCPEHAMKAALLADYSPPEGLAPYLSDEDVKIVKETFRVNGIGGPLCYYKCEMRGFNKEDEAAIAPERRVPPVSTPIFFGVGTGDLICTPKIGRLVLSSELWKDHNIRIKEFDGDHWITLSDGEAIARELDTWISGVVVPTLKA